MTNVKPVTVYAQNKAAPMRPMSPAIPKVLAVIANAPLLSAPPVAAAPDEEVLEAEVEEDPVEAGFEAGAEEPVLPPAEVVAAGSDAG